MAVAVLLAAASPAAATTYTVTGLGDANVGCTTAPSCPTIRSALAHAAAVPGPHTIVVPAGTTQLNLGELMVDSNVTILGAGARATRIQAGDPQGPDPGRVFYIVSGFRSTIASLTMSGGDVGCCDSGGNLLNEGGTVTLDHVRVTGGHAGEGGGVANLDGTMAILHSLIDNNSTLDHDSDGDGGGVLNAGEGSGATAALTIRDSTISNNTAASPGGGISAHGNPSAFPLAATSTTSLERVTIANNVVQNSFSTDGGGIARGDGAVGLAVTASIVSGNTIDNGVSPVPSNCGGTTLPTSSGGNVVGTTDCGFAGPADAQGVNPMLSPTLVNGGGQTDVFTIPAASPALDRAAGCAGADQRGLPRPQGSACDSGAYEIDQAPETALSGTGLTFTFSSPEPGVGFQCRLNPAAFAPCTSPQTYSGLAPGTYTFSVRAVDGAGNVDPTPASQAFTIQAPAPQFHKTVVLREVSGRVRVRAKGKRRYVALSAITRIPLGSTVDTRRGVVELTSKPGRNKKAQKAKFYDGIFKVTQPGKITQLRLTEALAKCKRSGGASAAAKKKKKKKRRLWGNGRGKFRTKGSYSSATVRGTKWLTSDSCAGTLTRVVRGSVTVRDRVKRKTIRVRKGKRYLARPPR